MLCYYRIFLIGTKPTSFPDSTMQSPLDSILSAQQKFLHGNAHMSSLLAEGGNVGQQRDVTGLGVSGTQGGPQGYHTVPPPVNRPHSQFPQLGRFPMEASAGKGTWTVSCTCYQYYLHRLI